MSIERDVMGRSAMAAQAAPFQFDWDVQNPVARAALALARPVVGSVLALKQLNHTYANITALGAHESVSDRALKSLRIKLDVDDASLQMIPKTGPLVVVANHPFGGIDGLALLSLIKRRRPDVKILANDILKRVPDLSADSFFVDPFGGESATRRNLTSVRAAMRWVKDGGALAVFPAGEVSSLALRKREVCDIVWSATVAGIVRATGASVLPVFFSGRNSKVFQLAGLVSPRLRTILLPRELLKKRGSTIHAQIGSVIS